VEVAKRLRESISFDEDEIDSEFQLAKDEQGLVEGRISELEILLAKAQILKVKKSNGRIMLGSTVMVQEEGGDPEEFTIVGFAEANPRLNLISDESPLGSSLIGYKKGDSVEISAPKGKIKFEILGIK
jgi:transcription elongation factor GreA